jgi:hypothetical protein
MKPVQFIPKVLQWARERADLDIVYLAHRMKVSVATVTQWETTGELSIARAKKLSSYTRTPLGYLFLAAPLSDKLPIPDFCTIGDELVRRPSPDLLDTVHVMQRRQEWMHDFLID